MIFDLKSHTLNGKKNCHDFFLTSTYLSHSVFYSSYVSVQRHDVIGIKKLRTYLLHVEYLRTSKNCISILYLCMELAWKPNGSQRYVTKNGSVCNIFLIYLSQKFKWAFVIACNQSSAHLSSVSVSECIGVLRHMQRYFSHVWDGTDVQADWWRSCTYGRVPNAIDIS